MKRLLNSLLCAIGCFLSHTSYALPIQCHGDHCLYVGAEYLYLKPTFYDPFFLIPEGGPTNTNQPRGKRFANEVDYHSGVRGWAVYRLSYCDPLDLFAEGMYISDDHDRSISIGTQAPKSLGTKGNPLSDLNSVEAAMSCIDYRLWNVKGGFSYCFCTPGCFLASTHLNVHYVKARFQEKIFYDETMNVVSIDSLSDTWAIGPEVGVDIGYQFFSCLALVARGSYALLVADHESKVSEIDILSGKVEDTILADNDRLNTVQAYLEMKVGLNYQFCWCNFTGELEVGFDVIRYTDLLDRIRWVGDRESNSTGTEGASFDYFSPFMLHGLYASAGLAF